MPWSLRGLSYGLTQASPVRGLSNGVLFAIQGGLWAPPGLLTVGVTVVFGEQMWRALKEAVHPTKDSRLTLCLLLF